MALRLVHYSDVENAYDDPESIGRLAGALQALTDRDTLVVGTGDNTSPGVLALFTEGRQALPFFRAVAPDFDTFGNHDFDYGPEATLNIVRESPQTWVSANVRRNGSVFGTEAGVVETATRTVGGTTVGVFGLTVPSVGSINPNATGLTVTDPLPAAVEAADALRAAGADLVVALSHLGLDDEELAAAADLDVVLGGHIHSERVERIDDVVLTRPGVNGRVVLSLSVAADGSIDVERHEIADFEPDPAVVDAMERRLADLGLDEVVATVEEPIVRDERTAFRGESRIGNFVADAYRWAADADVGLQNSGGIRAGPPLAGDVTLADLVSVVPFKEPVTLARLTGTELCSVFRQASGANLSFGEPGWWHGHVSGASLVWDHGSHELVSATVDGEPVDPAATYTLATTDYLFHTDHEFPALADEHRVERLDTQYEVLAEYARTADIDPQLEGRIVQNGIDE